MAERLGGKKKKRDGGKTRDQEKRSLCSTLPQHANSSKENRIEEKARKAKEAENKPWEGKKHLGEGQRKRYRLGWGRPQVPTKGGSTPGG